MIPVAFPRRQFRRLMAFHSGASAPPRRPAQTAAAMLILLSLAAAGCDAVDAVKIPPKQPPLVAVVQPQPHRFINRIMAVGTARANEQVTLSSPVTERIERLMFSDGGLVRKGQIIALLAQDEEQAALAGARAGEQQALSQLARIEALSERGFATGTTLDLQQAAARRARAQAASAQAQIDDRVIRSPFTGYASLRTISEGAIVASGTPIATISDISRIKLDFTVPETALRSIRSGQTLLATSAAWPDKPVRGTIETIDPVIDPSTRAVTVRAILANPENRLKPGMLLKIAIEADAREGLALPEIAIIGEGAERFVFEVGEDGKAHRIKVNVGTRDAAMVEVTGLSANAQIISEGVVKVSDGSKVRIRQDRRAAGAANTPSAAVPL